MPQAVGADDAVTPGSKTVAWHRRTLKRAARAVNLHENTLRFYNERGVVPAFRTAGTASALLWTLVRAELQVPRHSAGAARRQVCTCRPRASNGPPLRHRTFDRTRMRTATNDGSVLAREIGRARRSTSGNPRRPRRVRARNDFVQPRSQAQLASFRAGSDTELPWRSKIAPASRSCLEQHGVADARGRAAEFTGTSTGKESDARSWPRARRCRAPCCHGAPAWRAPRCRGSAPARDRCHGADGRRTAALGLR